MRTVSRKTRIGFALLAALGMMVAPSTAWAGKFNLAGGGSRISSGAAAKFVAPRPAMSMKSNFSSNLGSAAKFNAGPKFNATPKISAMPKFNTAPRLSTMPKLSSSRLSSNILGNSASNNTSGRLLSRSVIPSAGPALNTSASPIWAAGKSAASVVPAVNAGKSGIIIVGGKSATSVGGQLMNKIQNQNRNADVFGDFVDGVESGFNDASQAVGSVLDPLLPGTSATGTGPSQPSSPPDAPPSPAKPSIVERAGSQRASNAASDNSKYLPSIESNANKSKELTGGKVTDNSRFLNPLVSAADRSKPATGGVQYDKGPYVTPKSVPIPSGPMSTGGDGAGTADSGPTGGSASTPSAPSTGTPSTSTPTGGVGQLPFPLPLPLPYPSGGGVYGGSIGGGAVLTSASTPVSVTTADVSAEAMPEAAATSNVDLVIEDIRLESPATLVAGPAYRVTFRNQGTTAAANFQVALLAGLDGKLADDAPRAVVEVASLAAGQVGEVVLRLPQRALMMKGTVDGKPTAFTHLYLAVDLMNTVAESDETNNTAVVERSALEMGTAM